MAWVANHLTNLILRSPFAKLFSTVLKTVQYAQMVAAPPPSNFIFNLLFTLLIVVPTYILMKWWSLDFIASRYEKRENIWMIWFGEFFIYTKWQTQWRWLSQKIKLLCVTWNTMADLYLGQKIIARASFIYAMRRIMTE